MNSGKICISVGARTIAGFIELIDRAVEMKPDLIELRFDSLDADELAAFLADPLGTILARCSGVPTITTFRPKEYGGCRDISSQERSQFWSTGYETEIADVEEDTVDDTRGQRICSFHDFNGMPADLDSIFERMAKTGAEVVKLAVTVKDAADAIPIWKLLDRANGVKVIPIGMGEAGKWTRILGLAHGSSITYASIDSDNKTAPGQFSATDLRDIFRVRELDLTTSVYGVVAGDTSYSLSPYMHNAAFAKTNLNSVFIPFQVADLAGFLHRIVSPDTREIDLNVAGFSVTNPHKQAIIPHLDQVEETARAIGAVNTVKVVRDELYGFNTDAEGFIRPLIDRFADLRGARVSVAGAGGAARACVYMLKTVGADVTVLARNDRQAQLLAEEFGVRAGRIEAGDLGSPADILVNATPLGTRGENENDAIASADQLRDVKLVYDLVYNPLETRLLKEARAAGAMTLGGLDMLVAQGARQFAIWTDREAPVSEMRQAVESRLE